MSKKINKFAFGISSRTFDNSHIFMCDIDESLPISSVISIAKTIQRDFLLSDVFIVSSSNGYNLFSLDKLPLKLVYIINNSIKESCKKYNEHSFFKRRFYVLRMGEDKEVIDVVVNEDNVIFAKSTAHRIFFENVLKGFETIPFADDTYDGNTRFWITKFVCNKHGWRLE